MSAKCAFARSSECSHNFVSCWWNTAKIFQDISICDSNILLLNQYGKQINMLICISKFNQGYDVTCKYFLAWLACLFLHSCHKLIWKRNMSRRMTKLTKWPVRPAKTQISLGIRPLWSESSLSAWRNIGPLTTYWVHSGNSDQSWQADLSLCWAHIIFWFCVAAHMS